MRQIETDRLRTSRFRAEEIEESNGDSSSSDSAEFFFSCDFEFDLDKHKGRTT